MQRPTEATHGAVSSDTRARTDVAWLAAACVILALLALQFRLTERALNLTHAAGTYRLDAYLALAVLLPLATTAYAVRRYRDSASVRAELARMSGHDSLTGLPNRAHLRDWLAADLVTARRSNALVAVLFIDLDRFKLVNDTYGHDVGDQLMVAVAGRLEASLRPADRLLRYGGDEFIVICSGVANLSPVQRLGLRIIDSLEAPFTIGTDSMCISTSIGIALAGHLQASPDELLRQADVAMYRSKALGSGTCTVFDKAIHGDLMAPLSTETRLREALAHEEFRLGYRPMVDLRTGDLVGVEAHIGWEDPERGSVPTAEFEPVLEESGLIVPVGGWVLHEACGQARRWADQFPHRPALRVTVRVSARQLAQVDFPQHITQALRDSGVAPDQICLEINETALTFDVASVWTALRHVKSLGVRIALGEFGVGSSLSYVRRLSLDVLKIDGSYVEGLGVSPEDTIIVDHVIAMTKALGVETVADGVELPLQMHELQRLGCDLAQGPLFSEALPAEAIEDLITNPDRTHMWATWVKGPRSRHSASSTRAPSTATASTVTSTAAPAPTIEPTSPDVRAQHPVAPAPAPLPT